MFSYLWRFLRTLTKSKSPSAKVRELRIQRIKADCILLEAMRRWEIESTQNPNIGTR